MIDTSPNRILSKDSGRWGETAPTTEGGQDKRVHVAPRSVGCFFEVFVALAHLVPGIGKVPNLPNSLFIHRFLHIVRCTDGR